MARTQDTPSSCPKQRLFQEITLQMTLPPTATVLSHQPQSKPEVWESPCARPRQAATPRQGHDVPVVSRCDPDASCPCLLGTVLAWVVGLGCLASEVPCGDLSFAIVFVVSLLLFPVPDPSLPLLIIPIY